MKKILIVWIFVAFISVAGLTVIGLKIKKENAPYQKLEKELEKQSLALTGAIPSFVAGGKIITIDDLNNNGYKVNMNVNGDLCEGYIYIEQSMSFYKYHPYIKCQKYTTPGYKNHQK